MMPDSLMYLARPVLDSRRTSVNKIVGVNDKQREAIEDIRTRFGICMTKLKLFKQKPTEAKKVELSACFDKFVYHQDLLHHFESGPQANLQEQIGTSIGP